MTYPYKANQPSLQCLDPPNITGIFWADQSGNPPEGAFAFTEDTDGRNHSDDNAAHRISFDASRCSFVYVNEATLQPSALQALVCIKA